MTRTTTRTHTTHPSSSSGRSRADGPGLARGAAPAPALHRALGNQAVGQLLRAQGGGAGLSVSAPGDRHERDADHVSAQVMRMPEPRGAGLRPVRDTGSTLAGPARRKPGAPATRGAAARVAPSAVHDVLRAPGRPLDDASRGFMEPRLGYDLGGVRVHTGAAADAAAASVSARAFTVGHDVVFGRGEFAPHTGPGRALLAHELAHVAQGAEGGPRLYRQPAETHYPTEEEQRAIQKALDRDLEEVPVPAATTTDAAPVETAPQGKALTEPDRQALANRLKPAYFTTIATLTSGSASGAGGLDEGEAFDLVEKARTDIYDRFGGYAHRQFTLTRDETTTSISRHREDQVLVRFTLPAHLDQATARTIATTHCSECLTAIKGLDTESKAAVIQLLMTAGLAERGTQISRITARRVPGAYTHGTSVASLRLAPPEEFYQTAVHELIHALAHPVFRAAFGDEDYVNEGFTEYFTQQVVGYVDPAYEERYNKVVAARNSMTGPFSMFAKGAEESMRQAYFQGRLDLIGWRPTDKAEEDAVKEVDPRVQPWDARTAAKYAEIYQARALARQDPSSNVLGMGLYFNRTGDRTISVRYTRVLKEFNSLSSGRLLVDAAAFGTPVKPEQLGASLGIAAEYQSPRFYAQGGVRFTGTASLSGDPTRVDFSPFAGLGLRLWQTVRIGPEAMLAIPVKGDGISISGGITLGLEFGGR